MGSIDNITNKFYDIVFKLFKIKSVLSFKYVSNLTLIGDLFQKLTILEKERDQLFTELEKREQTWSKLMLVMFDWAWITNKDGKYSYISPRAEEIYGFKNGDIVGKMPHEFLTDEYKEDAIKTEQYLIESRKPLYNYVTDSYDSQGHKIRTTTNCTPLFGSDGGYIGHVGVEKILNIDKE